MPVSNKPAAGVTMYTTSGRPQEFRRSTPSQTVAFGGKRNANANPNSEVKTRKMNKSELEAMKARAPKVSDLYYR
jgi:hypothetical protein